LQLMERGKYGQEHSAEA